MRNLLSNRVRVQNRGIATKYLIRNCFKITVLLPDRFLDGQKAEESYEKEERCRHTSAHGKEQCEIDGDALKQGTGGNVQRNTLSLLRDLLHSIVPCPIPMESACHTVCQEF